ncbi:MAG: DUF4833 domain-containing protein [Thermoanaerobaculales bacterium]
MTRVSARPALLLLVLLVPCRWARSADADGHLFVIERSLNANAVVYDAVTAGAGRLDPSSPLRVYWLMRAKHGEVSELNGIEWAKAYGYDVRSCNGGACTISLRALRGRPIVVEFANGTPRAVTSIGDTSGILRRVFVTVGRAGPFPSVEAVELFGESAETALPLHERLAIH